MRVQPDHWAVLLEFCEKNPEIITNKFIGQKGRSNIVEKWAELTVLLNSLGLGEKTTEEWKRTLIDWKSKTKAKASTIGNYQVGTGGGPPTAVRLTSLEERLLSIMGKVAVYGNREVKEVGLKTDHFNQPGPSRNHISQNSSQGPFKRPTPFELAKDPPAKKQKVVFLTVSKDNCQPLTGDTLLTPQSNKITNDIIPFNVEVHEQPTVGQPSALTGMTLARPQEVLSQTDHLNIEMSQPPNKQVQSGTILKEQSKPVTSATEQQTEQNTSRTPRRGRNNTQLLQQQLQDMNNNILKVLKNINNNIFKITECLNEMTHVIREFKPS